MRMIIATVFLAIATWAYAETLPAADSELLDGAGIPLYLNADFVYGNNELGFRFATSDSPEEVGHWYIEQMGDWSLFEDMGLWILYDGPPELEFGDIFMARSQITVSMNDELPGWYSLDESMTTEILIHVVK